MHGGSGHIDGGNCHVDGVVGGTGREDGGGGTGREDGGRGVLAMRMGGRGYWP